MALPQVGLEAVIANLGNFSAGAKTITNAYNDINVKAGAVEKATGALGTSLVGLGSHLLSIGAIAGGAALAGVTALGAGLATFAVVGINKAIDLDAQMATIAATMNTTKEAVGPLKDLILDLALDPNLTVNTTQAADAIQLLAQNGATADQIIGGLAASTVALANATGSDFGVAANVASGIMKVFNLEAKDMGIAVDGITGVVNQSKFTIDDYAQAFAQAGSVAAGMGVSLQDFNTVITATSDSFTSGSDAGTSFKTLLQRLANPTDEVRAVTEKYGISLFDATGNMRPLSEVAGQLNNVLQGTATITETAGGATKKMTAAAEKAQKAIPNLTTSIGQQESKLKLLQDELGAIAFHYGADSLRARKAQLAIDNLTISIDQNKTKLSDYQGAISAVTGAQEQQITSAKTLTEAEKAELAAVIGGADAARIVLALSQTTAAEFDTLSGKVNDVGQAFRSAATRVDSVSGAFEIFRGIVEAVQIQVGDKFLPILRGVTVGFTDLASKAGPVVVDFFGKIADTIATLVDKARGIIDVFGDKGLAGVFAKLGLKGSALFLKKLTELGSKFGFVEDGASSLGDAIKDAFKWIGDNLFPMLSDGLTRINSFIDTAKDLVTTFQAGGLFGSRSGSFGSEGLLAALGIPPDIIDTVQGVLDSITEKVNAFMTGGLFGTMKETPGGMQETGGLLAALGINEDFPTILENWAGQVIAAIPDVLTDILSSIATFAADNWPIISEALADWTTKFWDWAKDAAAGVGAGMAVLGIALLAWATSEEALASMTLLGQTIGTMLTDAIKLSFEGGEGIGTSMGSLMTGMGIVIASLVGSLIVLGGQIVAGILSGILESLGIDLEPTTFAELGGILTRIGTDIKTIASVVGNNIIKGIKTGWDNTVETVTTAFQTGVDSWMKIITETEWVDIGKGIIDGILKGIKDNAGKVLEKLKDLMDDFLSTAASAVGYGSPAAEFIPIGASIPEALIAGINSGAPGVMAALGNITQATIDKLLGVTRNVANTRGVIGAAADDVEKFLDRIGAKGAKGDLTLQILKDAFRDNADEILNATDRAAKFEEVVNRTGVNWERIFAGGSVNPFAGKGGGAFGVFINAFDKRKKELERLQQQIFIEAGKTALAIGNKLNDIVQGSVDVLDQRVETLQGLIDSGLTEVNFEGLIISQTQAQDLLNAALQEQADIQDDILQLKQNEQKLGFLEKQLALIDTLNAAGLNVQDILGGITLGLDASIPDMIEATNRLVMAMIEQVNADLQLGSPSKVMVKKGGFAGKGLGQGFVQGLMAQIPNITSAMQQAIVGPVSGPVLSGGSSSRVTNNNFNMAVTTGASPQNVINQFEIARSMV